MLKGEMIFETTNKGYVIYQDPDDTVLPYRVEKRVSETGYITLGFKDSLEKAKTAIQDDMWIRMLNKSGLWRITDEGKLI